MSQSKVQHIFRVFDALNLVKGIKAVGGPDHQTYYIESDVYAPDRRITPLILQPYVEVSDPNGVIPAGDKVGELSSASWYIGEAILANKITAKESEATLDTPFAIGENNALHVRKNSTKSILLIFEGEYLDIRKDKNIHISLTYTLTTTSNTEVKPAPKLMLSKPQSWKYCPLEDQTKAVIEATVSQDSKLYQSAVQWVKVEDDKETLIGEDDSFYLEGQNTDRLTINPSLMGSTLIRAKNHDEVFYNQVYGINPEWDEIIANKENVNLIFMNGSILGLISLDGSINTSAKDNFVCSRLILLEDEKSLYFFQNKQSIASDGGHFRIRWFDENMEYLGRSSFKDKEKVFEFEKNVKYVQVSAPLDSEPMVSYQKQSYRPAIEDLNGLNIIKNSKVISTKGATTRRTNGVQAEGKYYVGFEKYKKNGTGEESLDIHLFLDKERVKLFTFNIKDGDKLFSFKTTERFDSLSFYGGADWVISNETDVTFYNVKISKDYYGGYTPSPYDIAPHGILKGTYQSDIKFTRYFPKLETEIDFLTGDTLRAGMDTVKMKAVFKTNKEEIKNPEQYFDIKWYLDPVEAGGKADYLGQGESLEVPISKIPPKARAIPFRLEYEFK